MSTNVLGFDAEVSEQINAVVEHLTGHHNDTLRFVAMHDHDADVAWVEEADVAAIDTSSITLRLVGDAGSLERSFEFGEPIADAAGLQRELFSLINRARRILPDHPQTSIEREILATQAISTHLGQVTRVERITPNMAEITIGGLDDVEVKGGDEFFYVLVPKAHAPDVLRQGMTISEIQALPDDEHPVAATYTTRRRRPEAGELDIWVVLHGDHGFAGWAGSQAEVGDTIGVWGPRRGYAPPDEVAAHLLVVDETGLPAAAAIVETLPHDHPVTLIAEVIDEAHRPPLPDHSSLSVTWLHRGAGAPGRSGHLLRAVESLDTIEPSTFVFGAAESREISAVRRHLRDRRGLPRTHVHMTGYWRA